MFGFARKKFLRRYFQLSRQTVGLSKVEYFLDLERISGRKESVMVMPAKAEQVMLDTAKVEPVKSQKSEMAKRRRVEKKSARKKDQLLFLLMLEPTKVEMLGRNCWQSADSILNRIGLFAPDNLMPIPTGTRRTPVP
jgi:hypothetical protein